MKQHPGSGIEIIGSDQRFIPVDCNEVAVQLILRIVDFELT